MSSERSEEVLVPALFVCIDVQPALPNRKSRIGSATAFTSCTQQRSLKYLANASIDENLNRGANCCSPGSGRIVDLSEGLASAAEGWKFLIREVVSVNKANTRGISSASVRR